MEDIINSVSGASPGGSGRKKLNAESAVEELRKEVEQELRQEMGATGKSKGSKDGLTTPTASTSGSAGSSNGSGGPKKNTDKPKGKGRGKGRFSQAPKNKVGEGEIKDRLGTVETLLVMCLRMVCSHANEFRRIFRETQVVYKLAGSSPAKEELSEEHQNWKKAIPEKSEENPFPQHAEGPLRFFTFRRMFESVKKHAAQRINEVTEEDEKKEIQKAVEITTTMHVIRQGVLRFYKIREGEEETEENQGSEKTMQMWMVKYAPNSQGNKLQSAVTLLGSRDLLDAIGMHMEQDRAPKGGLQRGIESALERLLGKNKNRGGSTENSMDEA